MRARLAHCLVLLLVVAWPAWAGPPMDAAKVQTDRALAALADPALKGPEHRVERQAVIRLSMDALFDFTELSQRVLGAEWAARTPAERAEFATAFSEFVKAAYLNQIDLYRGEKLVYAGDVVEGDLATVTARLETHDGGRTVLEFKMHRAADGAWRAYDVTIDGFSILDNYRAQFRAMLRRGTWAELVARVKKPPAPR